MTDLSVLRTILHPLPPAWTLLTGLDTGTYLSACFVLFPPEPAHTAFVIAEFPNYRYVGGELELLGLSIPEWSRALVAAYHLFHPGRTRLTAFCDENSQFKTELAHYGIALHGNRRKLELRVEIAREYFANRRVWLAPWLSVLPYELELAQWPPATSSAGRFERLKEHDHTLDTIEHVLSRRPRHKSMVQENTESLIDQHLREHRWRDGFSKADPHLGVHG